MAIALLATCGALAGTVGCGGDETTTTAGQSPPPSESTTATARPVNAIDIADFKYDPETVAVDAGTEVTWTNSDDAAHTATADDSSFDTGDLDQGESKSVTFDKPGTFTYYCRFHPFMKATVEVQ